MLGWRLLRDSEIELQRELGEAKLAALTAELAATKAYVAKCEHLIDHERGQIIAERERADRIADSLFQSSGLPPTSVTVVSEQKAAETIANDKRVDYMKQIMEIYSETEDELVEDGAEPLPEEVLELAK